MAYQWVRNLAGIQNHYQEIQESQMYKLNSAVKALLFSVAGLYSVLLVFIAPAHAVMEGHDDFVRAVDPALGISVQLGRWNGAINLVYDPDGAPDLFSDADEFLVLLAEAAAEWELVSGIEFNVVGTDPDVPDDDGAGPDNLDGLVRVFWGSAGGAAGRAGPDADFYDSDVGYFPYIDGAVELNQNPDIVKSSAELVGVLVHELGHLMGLGHSDNPASIMYANPYNQLLHPRADDIQAARTLYGNGSLVIEDINQPIAQWLYAPYADAPDSELTFLFKPNQAIDSGAFISVGSDVPVPVITESTQNAGFVRFNFGGIGNFTNDTAIDIDATVIFVDPFGYIYDIRDTELFCNVSTACGGGWISVGTASAIKTIPGEWTVHVVDDTKQSNLLTLQFSVATQTAFNQPPQAAVTVTGAGNNSVTISLDVTDADSSSIDVIWHAHGNLGDQDNDGFLDTNITDSVQSGQTIDRTLSFLSVDTHTLYVELNDDGVRYDGSKPDSSSAGRGFQSLLAITVDLPVASAEDVTVVSTFAGGNIDAGNGSGAGDNNSLSAVVDSIATSRSLQLITTSDQSSTSAQFFAGAILDNGTTTATDFLNNDNITIAGSLVPNTADVGKAGEIYVVLISNVAPTYLDTDGNFQLWNSLSLKRLEPAFEITTLGAIEKFPVFSGKVQSGLYRVFLGYKLLEGGPLHFNAKAFRVNVD